MILSTSFTYAEVASYYTEGSHTSSGERYNMHAATCAHKKLPFNTVVELTNISNNKVATCRVNDRGPFIRGRDFDVSLAVAKALDFIKAGTARIKVKILGNSKNIKKAEGNPLPISLIENKIRQR